MQSFKPYHLVSFLLLMQVHFIASIEQLDASTNYDERLFKTSFLSNYDEVAKTLIKEKQFQEVQFTATDGVKLCGLMRIVPNAKSNIIFCAGFYPGRKEGLATFIELVPKDANLLFFDARGHGKSEGYLFGYSLLAIKDYGKTEHKDIVGAIKFMHEKDAKQTFIHGVCAGAYHAAKAIKQLEEDKNHPYNIKGIIFDSGFASLLSVADIPQKHFREKVIPGLLRFWYANKSKEDIQKTLPCKILSCLVVSALNTLSYFVLPSFKKRSQELDITNDIATLSSPILIIHSRDDAYSPIENIIKLAQAVKNKRLWLIEDKSEHASHHLKYTEKYKEYLNQFLSEHNQ
jgi:pimeloyl-ACP methyl ester carboxylesterase